MRRSHVHDLSHFTLNRHTWVCSLMRDHQGCYYMCDSPHAPSWNAFTCAVHEDTLSLHTGISAHTHTHTWINGAPVCGACNVGKESGSGRDGTLLQVWIRGGRWQKEMAQERRHEWKSYGAQPRHSAIKDNTSLIWTWLHMLNMIYRYFQHRRTKAEFQHLNLN